jgi:hypothetical protein
MKPSRPRRPFVDLRPAEVEPAAHVDPGRFLGRFGAAALRQELADAGILDGLAARGYGDVVIRTSVAEGEHQLKVFAAGGTVALVDLRLAEASSLLREPLLLRLGLEVLSFLSMHWIALQDPRASFSADKPRLPGQDHPGLGLLKQFYLRLIRWADDWGKDGLVNFPDYYHNAVFYSQVFRFVSPVRQGRFEALRAVLAPLGVAAASWAVDEGRVAEETEGPTTPYAWEPGEMVAPLAPDLRRYLESDAYRRAVEAARAKARFVVRGGVSEAH